MDVRFQIGSVLIVLGILLVVSGIGVLYLDKIPLIGRLPGDINIHGKGWSVHVPIMTGILISIFLTIILNLFFRR